MKQFAIIGLGNFGFHAAKNLFEDGNHVVAIDVDKNKVQNIDPFASESIVMDATDKKALAAMGLNDFDGVVVSIGSRISTSTLICLYLKEIGVKKIIAKAIDEDHEKILKLVGATEIIHPERDIAVRISRSLSQPNMLDFLPLAHEFEIIQMVPPEDFVGKDLKQLNLRALYNVHILAIKQQVPDHFLLVPPANFIIKATDILILLGKSENIRKIKICS